MCSTSTCSSSRKNRHSFRNEIDDTESGGAPQTRLGHTRQLLGSARESMVGYMYQIESEADTAIRDSDWSGCRSTKRSTSGGYSVVNTVKRTSRGAGHRAVVE